MVLHAIPQAISNLLWSRKKYDDDDTSDDDDTDEEGNDEATGLSDAEYYPGLSYVGEAVHQALRVTHFTHHKACWNVSHGKVVGELVQSPPRHYWGRDKIDPETTHSDQALPQQMYDTIIKAQRWLDITTLAPPDGKFLEYFARALGVIAERANRTGNTVVIRVLVANIVGLPVNCHSLMESLLEEVPDDSNIEVWVGAWRKGVSWNHAKIIAVDGNYLMTGGHNLWDPHYLQTCPVHDVSMKAEGVVAEDGHCFANLMWRFIENTDRRQCLMKLVPDWMPFVVMTRVGCASWPETTADYPPQYKRVRTRELLHPEDAVRMGDIPMISMGRYGSLHNWAPTANPSDSGIIAMLGSAQTIVRMSLQDLGPLTLPLPGMNQAIPGGVWPVDYMQALAEGIYDRGVDVEIVLSNPHAVPGRLSPMTANYGNGWSCADVASEIIKAIKRARPHAADERLRQMVDENLRVCFMRSSVQKLEWPEGQQIGNHAKFFMVDDRAYYVGSQNLYICDLAEWGLVIDNLTQTQRVKAEYWDPMWMNSWNAKKDADVNEIMDGLDVDRDGSPAVEDHVKALAVFAHRKGTNVGLGQHVQRDIDEVQRHHGVDEETAGAHFEGYDGYSTEG